MTPASAGEPQPVDLQRRRKMSWVMAGCAGAALLGAILPWVQVSGFGATANAVDSGLQIWQGWAVAICGAGLGLYAFQGLSPRFTRIEHHGWAIAAIVVIVFLATAITGRLDEVSGANGGLVDVKPGPGLIIAFLAGLVAIWPLVVLRRMDKAQVAGAELVSPPEAEGAPAQPKAARASAGAAATKPSSRPAAAGPARTPRTLVAPLVERIPQLERWPRWILPAIVGAVIAVGAIVIWNAATGGDEKQAVSQSDGGQSLESILQAHDSSSSDSGGFFPPGSSSSSSGSDGGSSAAGASAAGAGGASASSLGVEDCGNGVAVGPSTTCPFALNVAAKFRATGGSTVTAYSPARSRNFEMNCVDGTPTVCRGGDDAAVFID